MHTAAGPAADKLSAVKFIHFHVSFLSKTLIHWLNSLLLIGFRRTLCLEDLGKIPERESTAFNFHKLKQAFDDEKKRSFERNCAPSLWRCFWRLTYSQMIVSGLFKLVSAFLFYISPLSLEVIITFVETERMNSSANATPSVGIISIQDYFGNGYVMSFIVFVTLIVHILLIQHNYLISTVEGIRCKCAIQALVFDKCLRVMTSSVNEGRVMNHMTIDPVHIVTFFNVAHYVWTMPIDIATGFLILYFQLGKSALISSMLVLLLVPVQYLLAWKLARVHKHIMELSDHRMKISNELLQSIKLLKLYAWERLLERSVNVARQRELCMMLRAALLRVLSVTCTDGIPCMACLLTFVLYNRLETEPLSAAKVFSSVAVFSHIANQLFLITIVINIAGQARSSVARLKSFFLLPELHNFSIDSSHEDDETQPLKPLPGFSIHHEDVEETDEQFAVRITDGVFTWSDTAPGLLSANVTVPQGKLTIIVGPVASGKSSLLYAMLGEMQLISGHISRRSNNMAIVPQSCWILNATVCENIVFGCTFDQSRYQNVLTAAGLERDMSLFPGGDQCEIGEKGATLSGGQKQRIAIARALYADADLVFLDDCLSALDAVVSAHVFNEAILKMLIGRGKTVVLVTHHIHLMNKADHLIVMKDQKVIYDGSPDTLEVDGTQQCTSLLKKLDAEELEEELRGESLHLPLTHSLSEKTVSMSHESLISENKFDSSGKLAGSESLDIGLRLVEEEQSSTGSVPWSVYLAYVKAAAWILCTVMVLLFILCQVIKMAASYFLTKVVDKGMEIKSLEGYNNTKQTDERWEQYEDFMMIYIELSVVFVVCVPLSALALELTTIMASKNLHQKLINSILSAPLKFFDRTPIGRILNRLSADMNVIDAKLNSSFECVMFCAFNVIGAIAMNSVFVPYFIIPVVPVFLLFFIVQRFFIASCRELQRLECVARSPVLAHVSQSLNGLTTIRAFGSQERFVQECFEKINTNQLPFMFYQTTIIWMGLRLDMLGACIVLAASVCAITSCLVGHIEPGMVGLVIAYAIMISAYFNWTMRGLSETQIHFNSVERVVQYCHLEREENTSSAVEVVADNWPTCGDIRLKSVSLTYGSCQMAVIHDVSLHILPGQKVSRHASFNNNTRFTEQLTTVCTNTM